jgi:hypothetical protein
VGVGAGGEK